PKIVQGLVARGYSDEDVRKLMGGNFLRVYEQGLPG
ncbi:MAG: membrane dipeptidase, partial [Deltaproteobacteria bacterium]|nr:membrane dipeptidase [Deltaproteobacteria bacterium]